MYVYRTKSGQIIEIAESAGVFTFAKDAKRGRFTSLASAKVAVASQYGPESSLRSLQTVAWVNIGSAGARA